MLWLHPLRVSAALALSLLVSTTALVCTTVRAQSEPVTSPSPPGSAVDAPVEPSLQGAPPAAAISAPAESASAGARPLACQCCVEGPAPARERTLTERLLLRQQWMMYREHERRQISLVAPVMGTLVGSAALGTAAWLFTGGPTHRVTGTIVSIFVVIPVLTASLVKLVKRVKKRRAMEHEIWAAPPLAHGPTAWTF